MKVAEIKQELLNRGIDEETIKNTTGKDNLLQLLNSLQDKDLELEDLVESDNEKISFKDESIPNKFTKEWQDYVMGQFWQEELVMDTNGEKHPTVHGLRRITELLIGEIISSECNTIKCPTLQDNTATVEFKIALLDHKNGNLFNYSDVADASNKNCEPPYNLHLSSMASSRAESKILRKILCLRGISHEEVAPATPIFEDTIDENAPMSLQQLSIINLLGARLDVNISKLCDPFPHFPKKGLTCDEAKQLISTLNALQKQKTIPDEMKGYSGEWNK